MNLLTMVAVAAVAFVVAQIPYRAFRYYTNPLNPDRVAGPFENWTVGAAGVVTGVGTVAAATVLAAPVIAAGVGVAGHVAVALYEMLRLA